MLAGGLRGKPMDELSDVGLREHTSNSPHLRTPCNFARKEAPQSLDEP